MKSVEIVGKSLSDAVEEGAKKLGVGLNDVEHTIIDEGSRGFLGIGARPTRIKVYLPGFENEPEVEEKPVAEVKKEAEKPAPKKEKPVKQEKKSAQEKPVQEKPVQEKPVQEKPVNNEAVVESVEQEEKPERQPLTDADKAIIIKSAEDFLKGVFGAMELKVEFNSAFLDNKQLVINMSGDEMGVVIGKRGQTLDSLQTLTNLVVNKSEYPYINVTLDTESYRERRKETLERLAFNLAKKCKHNRKNVVLEPMNPYERRIIHSTLQNDRYVTTYSEGVEPHRYVVITMKNNYHR